MAQLFRRYVTRRTSFLAGLLLGAGVTALALELPYVNWARLLSPVDTTPLVVRHDAKGDGRFGAPRSGGRAHRGIDLAAPLDSPVRAMRSGRVMDVGWDRGLGQYVALEHGEHLQSLYAHLNRIAVEAGQRVKQGGVLGAVGKTGNARHPWIMPHVHVEVWRDGTPIDPQSVGLRVAEVVTERDEADVRGHSATGSSEAGGE